MDSTSGTGWMTRKGWEPGHRVAKTFAGALGCLGECTWLHLSLSTWLLKGTRLPLSSTGLQKGTRLPPLTILQALGCLNIGHITDTVLGFFPMDG